MGLMNKLMAFMGLVEETEIEEEVEEKGNEVSQKRNHKLNNVVSINNARDTGVKVVLVEPRSYDEVGEIADHLRERKCVVINLQRISIDQGKRIVDFLSGAVYALNGEIQKIGINIFLCTPSNVDIQGTISEMFHHEVNSV